MVALMALSFCDWSRGGVKGFDWQAEEELEELERLLDESLNEIEVKETESRDCMTSSVTNEKRTREATEWIQEVDKELRTRSEKNSYKNWDYITNITDYNERQSEISQNELDSWMVEQVKKARDYLRVNELSSESGGARLCNDTTVYLLNRLVHDSYVPYADSPVTRDLLNHLYNEMESIFAKASLTKHDQTYRLEPELTQLMAESRDYDELLWAWSGWHNVTGRPIKSLYVQLVDAMNEAARDNGQNDVSESWQLADYDMLTLEPMLDELYNQMKPFYELLHSYVRRKLSHAYPQANIESRGPIPAHLLGNMWAQNWVNIFPLIVPYPDVPQYDVTSALKRNGYTPLKMFQTAETFFISLGLEPMTQEFWNYSILVRPTDGRDIQCHGTAEDFHNLKDFRIKMCSEVNVEDFETAHHEMGHIEYFQLYSHQPYLFRTGTNAAFHEAIGDTITLSVTTPTHLQALGLLDESEALSEIDTYKQEINFLLRMSLEKIAFLPFAYVMDKWRFAVFRGNITPDQYNTQWWNMREQYQGIKAPVPRSEEDFDPAAKFHIPSNVPYSRYFLSYIGQFQFHEALCKLSSNEAPLHRCDNYKSKTAGNKLRSVLSLGASKPWPEVMKRLTGQQQFKVDSIMQYFKPLIKWLKKIDKKSHIGW